MRYLSRLAMKSGSSGFPVGNRELLLHLLMEYGTSNGGLRITSYNPPVNN